jgi:acetyl/propionyl-CoA carboxylase alpha subunit
VSAEFEVLWRDDDELVIRAIGGDSAAVRRFSYVRRGSELLLTDGHGYWSIPIGGASGPARHLVNNVMAGRAARPTTIDGRVTSQMPGKVLDVRARQGDEVKQGDVLLVLEAMKMEHAITAPFAGRVAYLTLTIGERVMPGDLLAEIEPAP